MSIHAAAPESLMWCLDVLLLEEKASGVTYDSSTRVAHHQGGIYTVCQLSDYIHHREKVKKFLGGVIWYDSARFHSDANTVAQHSGSVAQISK